MLKDKPRTNPVPLSDAFLEDLPEDVLRPNYDRSELRAGILHIGLGNFHRGHQAWYQHRLLQMGHATDWAIIGAGVRSYDTEMRDKLLSQDYLTTLIELDPSGMSAEITGSMIDYVPIEDGNGALVTAMSDPAIRIVSLTVTEGGYFIAPDNGGLDTDHPDIIHDASNPNNPRTAFGAMISALRNRRDAGVLPFTCLSCDNLQNNGDVLHRAVVALARLSDPDLADWIEDTGAFPNSMVDCIVPATGPEEIELVRRFGIVDAAPVTHESFRQWVIEDRFVDGRPDWDLVGATFTDSVHDYETMKLRILNGGHQVLANVGEILSISTIADCMQDADILSYWKKVQRTEISRYVTSVPEMSADAYVELVESRFSNPAILDTTRRVAFDGSSRHTGFLLPVMRDALKAGGSIQGLSLVEALWARMCHGTREDGTMIKPNDPNWDDLQQSAEHARHDPAAWLEQRQFYGDLSESEVFKESFQTWLSLIWSQGSRAALRQYNSS
ncbi:MAG: mannitol dehydrogenase family protein [Boseongicola sp.]|nr:MAG: mannitol dehydrogenase family protein [Boseongicola sp.]